MSRFVCFLTMFVFLSTFHLQTHAKDGELRTYFSGDYDSSRTLEELYLHDRFAETADVLKRIDREDIKEDELTVALNLLELELKTRTELARNPYAIVSEEEKIIMEQLLGKLRGDRERPTERWARASEAIGYTQLSLSRGSHDFQHVNNALEWWAGSSNINTARDEYLRIVDNILDYAERRNLHYSLQQSELYPKVLLNAVEIAKDDPNLGRYQYIAANTLDLLAARSPRSVRSYDTQVKILELYESALENSSPDDPWFPDLVLMASNVAGSRGYITFTENGSLSLQPDYEKALVWLELMPDYDENSGKKTYTQRALQSRKSILEERLHLTIRRSFWPGEQPQIEVSAKNLSKARVRIYRLDPIIALEKNTDKLKRQFNGDTSKATLDNIATLIEPETRNLIASVDLKLEEGRPHDSVNRTVKPEGNFTSGFYLVVAEGGEITVKDCFVVSDEGIISIGTAEETGYYITDIKTGKPISGARVAYIDYYQEHKKPLVIKRTQLIRADADGFVKIPADNSGKSPRRIITARGADGAFAFLQEHPYYSSYSTTRQQFSLYAYADRPVYRPGDEANWKAIIRLSQENTHKIPADKEISYTIRDRNNATIAEGTAGLSQFGTINGKLTLPDNIPLGPVYLEVKNASSYTTRTEIFSVEEYKTPEYKVTVTPDEKSGTPVPGSEVTVNIALEYYFGGPVTDAEVTVSVNEAPYIPWYPIQPYSWLSATSDLRFGGRLYHQPTEEIFSETVITDAEGKATITFRGNSHSENVTYTVTAVAQDSSRRVVHGKAEIKASSAGYFAFLTPDSVVIRQGATAQIKLATRTINETPVETDGVVIVEKIENRRVSPHNPRIIEDHEQEVTEVARIPVATDAEGLTTVRYKPAKNGYYRFRYFARDGKGYPIKAETTVWVVNDEQDPVWYRVGGFDIILEGTTAEVGKPLNAIIATPHPVDQVWLGVLADSIIEHKAVKMNGSTTQFITFEPDESWIPNVTIVGTYFHQGRVLQTQKPLDIAATRKLINVELQTPTDTLEPRDSLEISILTRDYAEKPMQAEVSLAVVDEAIYYIRPEIAQDIRAFFYGNRRYINFYIHSASNTRPWELEDDYPVSPAPSVDRLYRDRNNAFEDEALGASVSFVAVMEKQDMMMDADMEQTAEPVLRTNFSKTAFWEPAITTSLNGEAAITVTFPDSTTSWKILSRAVGADTTVGTAETTVRTRLPLIARLQTPRFLIAGDEVYISGVFNNNTDEEIEVVPELKADGVTIVGYVQDGKTFSKTPRIKISAQGTARVEWLVRAEQPTEAKIQLAGLSKNFSDAMELTLPVYEHGIDQLLSVSGKLDRNGGEIVLELPADRKPGSTTLEVNASPSLAASMLDAIPYLIEYAYGCTEQTLSRFVPLVAVRNMLNAQSIDPTLLDERFRDTIINSGHIRADKKQEVGAIDQLVEAGLTHLLELRKPDGSWGWFKETASDDWMTAYALYSLQLAHDAGIEVDNGIIRDTRRYLSSRVLSDNLSVERKVWVLYVLAYTSQINNGGRPTQGEKELLDALNRRRAQLSSYSVALLALSAHHFGQENMAEELIGVLTNGVTVTDEPDSSVLVRDSGNRNMGQVIPTASWGPARNFYDWYDSGIEATSFALMALLEISPDHELVEPAMNWLIKNRRGNRWTNTRDTAFAILAINRYFEITGDLENSLRYRLLVNGKQVETPKITTQEITRGKTLLNIDPSLLNDGKNLIEITPAEGYESTVYFSVAARFFNQTVPIKAAGNDLFIRRELTHITKIPTLLKGYVEKQLVVGDESTVQSGDRLKVTLLVDAKYDTEYALIEDLKGAGLENASLNSGSIIAREVTENYATVEQETGSEVDPASDVKRYTGRTIYGFQEIRDRKVAHFFGMLPKGVWEITYTLNVETPGKIHLLPAQAEAMYAPDLKGNSHEIRLTVE